MRDGGVNGYGTIFKITPAGTLYRLYSFCSQTNCPDGAYPAASLIQATNGDLYGTTDNGSGNTCPYNGAPDGCGTVFKITPGGTLTTLYSFGNGVDGLFPEGGVIQATDRNLYGTTYDGGSTWDSRGTVFKLTPNG
jgi:uncharacterized repeat protein (TIGR03803 family)